MRSKATVVYGLIAGARIRPAARGGVAAARRDRVSHRSRLKRVCASLGIEIPDERSVGISTWRRLQAASRRSSA